jgi:hypothetical protein
MKTYTPPTLRPYDDWHNAPDSRGVRIEASHPDYIPTPRQLPVIEKTRKALEQLEKAGKYPYCSSVAEIVAAAFGVAMTDPIINASKEYFVERGVMGSDIYYARRYIDTQKRIAANLEVINAANLTQGMRIGKIKINCKQAKACIIDELSKNGAKIVFTMGSKKYTAYMDSLNDLIESAKAAGNPLFSSYTPANLGEPT